MKKLAIILIVGIIINVVVIDRLHTMMNIKYDQQINSNSDNDKLSVRLLGGILVLTDIALLFWIYKIRTTKSVKL